MIKNIPQNTQENKSIASKIVTELLTDKTYHIEFNGHLTNHAKHAVIALAGLGVSDQKIKEYYENHAKMTAYGFPLEYPKSSKHKINEENWKNYIGNRTSFSSYCDFFNEQEQKFGIEQLIKKYLPILLPGWVGAFTHATIHLGWALSIENRYMIIEGLAYMAFSYVSCNPHRLITDDTSIKSDKTPTDSLLRIASYWDENRETLKQWVSKVLNEQSPKVLENIHPELRRSGLQYRIARILMEGHPLIYESPRWMMNPVNSQIWEELYFATSLLYLSVPGDFVLLHLITSLYAMEKIADYLPDNQKKYAIECYWIGMLCIVFSGSDFPKKIKLHSLNEIYKYSKDPLEHPLIVQDWEQITARAIEEEEEHNPKLVHVLKRIWKVSNGRTIYRTASAQFTKTPALPQSFEEPPVEEQDIHSI